MIIFDYEIKGISKIIFPEKSLSVRMSVCPVCRVPSRPPKKVAEFAKQSCQIYFKGDKKYSVMLWCWAKWSQATYIRLTHFRVSSPPWSWSQAVVCVSTPRKYPRSGYFLVSYIRVSSCAISKFVSFLLKNVHMVIHLILCYITFHVIQKKFLFYQKETRKLSYNKQKLALAIIFLTQ